MSKGVLLLLFEVLWAMTVAFQFAARRGRAGGGQFLPDPVILGCWDRNLERECCYGWERGIAVGGKVI
jgi:hypothetical protein